MALPKLNTNLIYETTIPSTGRNIKFRPFLVGEEKLFLIAAQSESIRVFYDTTKRVISQCVLDENFDVEELRGYDLDYLFLQLRARSVGEQEDLVVLCGECDTKNNYSVDFQNDVYILHAESSTEVKVDLGNGIQIQLKAPNAESLIQMQESNIADTEKAFLIIDKMIDKVYTQDEVFNFQNENESERQEFVQSMTSTQLQEVMNFLSNQPQVAVNIAFKCGNCGAENKRTLKGVSDFFG